jgi:AcrR family transcriptional regulator
MSNERRLTRAETKARTRALLLDAAARTFARKGYAGASVEEIAEAAGFSIGALYSNFGGKEQLFIELLTTRSSALIDTAGQIKADADVEDPAKALGRMLVEVADKDTDFAPLQAEFWLYAVRNPDVMETLAAGLREPHDQLSRLMGSVLDRVGGRDTADPGDVATIVLALFQGLVRQRRTDPASVPDELFGQALRWLFAGIAARSER